MLKFLSLVLLLFTIVFSDYCNSRIIGYQSNIWHEIDGKPFTRIEGQKNLLGMFKIDEKVLIKYVPFEFKTNIQDGGIQIVTKTNNDLVCLFSYNSLIKKGFVYTAFVGGKSLGYNLKEKYELYDQNEQTFTFIKDSTIINGQTEVNLSINYNGLKQVIVSTTAKFPDCVNNLPFCANSSLTEPDISCTLRWAGDIDGDSLMDILIHFYGYGWEERVLLLSSYRKQGQIVGVCYN